MKKRGATYTKGTKPNPKQKDYTINNREAVALIDYMAMIMMVNMLAIGAPSARIQPQTHNLTQFAGSIYLNFGYAELKNMVHQFIAHYTEEGKRAGKVLILPQYQFMNKRGEMIDIKELLA